jgi:hypothetical protein
MQQSKPIDAHPVEPRRDWRSKRDGALELLAAESITDGVTNEWMLDRAKPLPRPLS